MVERVQRLADVVSSIPGVRSASVTKHDLSEMAVGELSQLPYADLPLAVLRRSEGSLPHELLIGIEFDLNGGAEGWLALEFLSWWVLDAARSGSLMQLRSLALPPLEQQFGETLKFTIDWFHADPEQDMERLLVAVDELAAHLASTLDHYAIAERITAAAGQTSNPGTAPAQGGFVGRLRNLFTG
ncbi:hypothetical protein [Stenotrophomonas lactitubi]|uniref:hypothetical protein n=1 Tax=Stenotrophomonas lactitubi TaxID=2045214 RepID=UPI003209313A